MCCGNVLLMIYSNLEKTSYVDLLGSELCKRNYLLTVVKEFIDIIMCLLDHYNK